ncbi:hypothetical protein FSP39_001061 [Pinctada imbricata]|uniref:C2H2-type domain-containing protein n=1 Tax=Pinctada imbricata TaxID=66713 RepID=A0AA88XMI6_PINIB|nr:hypothetical protein FSP39_001061 [Pinctada imbricata]
MAGVSYNGGNDGAPTLDPALLDIPEAENPLQCRYCGKILTRIFYRKEHERIHTGEKPFACMHCGKRFNSQGTCRKHERTHGKNKRGFECEHCGRKFFDFRYYKSHLRSHEGDKPYSCHICDRSFGVESVLKKHLQFHNEQNSKQYQCTSCPKTFSTAFDLKEHLRTHIAYQQYKCRYCNLKFASEKKRSFHEKCHERSDVHECKYCGKAFGSANALATHEAKSEVAGGCDLNEDQGNTLNGSYMNGSNSTDIGYLGQNAEGNSHLDSDQGIGSGSENTIYPTGLIRSTDRGIVVKQEAMESMSSFPDPVEENGVGSVDGASNSQFEEENQQYILSPSNTFGMIPAVDKSSQTDPQDNNDLQSLEAAGKIHECKICQIIFRNYTMFLVHKTLHANPQNPLACHLCSNVANDNVDFNAHLIWHMK